jgi:hypothetical protein
MPVMLICDTNVFYNLGAKKLTPAQLTGAGEILSYSPITPLELAGKWTDRTHADRRAAAEAIITSGAKELWDPETHLAALFGYQPAAAPFSFAEGVKAMATTKDLAELIAGVDDVPAGVVRRVTVPAVNQWRSSTERKWVQDMLAIQAKEVPGFTAWYDPDPTKRGVGPVPRLTGQNKTNFLAQSTSTQWAMQIIVGCQDRALLAAKTGTVGPPTKATVVKLSTAIQTVSCYCALYTQYLIRLLTEGALPDENDSGDLELFLYSTDDDYVVATSEKKWKTMAENAGFANRVRLLTI